ncbi:MAG TPA: hypothetical protein VJR30_11260 [Bradyrhizobium sp.]|nr:hypothetical protein [Bradyrhizobium sp.]
MTRLAPALLIGGTCVALPLSAYGEQAKLAMLDQLESGAWELRQPGAGGPVRSICLDSGRKLIQLRHPDLACNSVIVEDTPNAVTVQYTCHGQGYGRTHVRRETNSLIQLDSQGIVDGRPFAFAAEGRRVGTCRS